MNARSVESLETGKGAQKKVEAKRFWFCQISHILPNSLLPLRRRKNHFFFPEKEKRKPSVYWVLCIGFLSVCEAADTTLLSLLLLLCVQRLGDGVAFFFVNNFWHPFHSPLFVFQLCAAEHTRSLSLTLVLYDARPSIASSNCNFLASGKFICTFLSRKFNLLKLQFAVCSIARRHRCWFFVLLEIYSKMQFG